MAVMSRMNPEQSEGEPAPRPRIPSPPRWVKVFAAVAAILFLLFLVLHVTGHGFGAHAMHGAGS